MRIGSSLFFIGVLGALTGCSTYTDVKEIKHLGFSQDLSQGRSVGLVESDDCVFHVFGHWLGGAPRLDRALAKARHQQKSQITDVVGRSADTGASLRYASGITTMNEGFDAVVFGKRCITVRGMGYL